MDRTRSGIKELAMKKMTRALGTLIVLILLAGAARAAEPAKLPPAQNRVKVEKNVMVPMSDGAQLATDLYFPVGVEKAPVVLIRTPYGKNKSGNGPQSVERVLAAQGYIVIVQDVRGRYGSGGEFYPFLHDGKDGQEMIAWIHKQPWFGGKLGTYGASYLGTTQWFEAPGEPIDAMHLTVTSPNLKEVLYTDGELHLMTVLFWSGMMGEHKAAKGAALKMAGNFTKYASYLPAGLADDKLGQDVPYFDDALDPAKIWQVYQAINYDDRYRQVSAPAVLVAGWYDMFLGPQLGDFNRLLKEGQGAAKDSILVVGPWGHGRAGDGSVSYGPDAPMDKTLGARQALLWFNRWLKGDTSVTFPRVHIFVMGDNAWRDENEWPLARTQYTKYYLHSGGKANTRKGDGSLSTQAPAAEPADKFDYDPLKPVPTKGGNSLGLNLGAYNQAKLEDRPDVLCFTSPPLSADLEVTGPITAELFAASDAKDTDFTMKLVDVYPDGKAINIQDGVVRAMNRHNDPSKLTPLTPGAVEKYELDLWATSNVFKAGHQLRVEVSSSNFPRFNRNLNTGESPLTATTAVTAHQTIVHDVQHPSHIVLPVIPR
jgi:uncharacterized protein